MRGSMDWVEDSTLGGTSNVAITTGMVISVLKALATLTINWKTRLELKIRVRARGFLARGKAPSKLLDIKADRFLEREVQKSNYLSITKLRFVPT